MKTLHSNAIRVAASRELAESDAPWYSFIHVQAPESMGPSWLRKIYDGKYGEAAFNGRAKRRVVKGRFGHGA